MNEILEIPLCDTQGLFYDECGRTADKPLDLADRFSVIDETAILSILQFGAIIPPLSPWKGIHRFVPGYRYCDKEIVSPSHITPLKKYKSLNPQQQVDETQRCLDHVLVKLIGDREDPILLFSGGVDSGLIASRLAALGYRDSLLLNYSFGDKDEESLLAENMAKHLGLRFERFLPNSHIGDCLKEPGRIYPQPFGDHSTVTSWDFCQSVVIRLSGVQRVIIDGTGADGAFGMTRKIDLWNRVFRIPYFFRKVASDLYRSRFWYRQNRLEYLFRIFRRSTQMPLQSAILAQNPLADILYDPTINNNIDKLLWDWISGVVGPSLPQCIVAGDLALTCSNIFAQKGNPILESAGHDVVYPFLENEMVALGLTSIGNWEMLESKAPLKGCLARSVPADMVYRPKSGFVDTGFAVFFESEFIDYLISTVDESNKIAFILDKKSLLKACDLLADRNMLPGQTLNCLWAITFLSRWYQTK